VLGVPVTLASAAGAGGYVGALWFKAVIEAATSEHPGVVVTAVLDCGEEPGTALGALRAGIKRVRFSGANSVREKLAAIAEAQGAAIEAGDEGDEALDLLDRRDPDALCRAFLAGNQPKH
jgi:hypothetical protein